MTLPDKLQVVAKPSEYYAALEFCDFRMPDNVDMSDVKNIDPVVEPACVAILETIVGKDYLENVDDELIYDVLSGANEANASGDKIALASSFQYKSSDSKLRLYDAVKPVLSPHRPTKDSQRVLDEKVRNICEYAFDKFSSEFDENNNRDVDDISLNSKIEPSWKDLHHFIASLTERYEEDDSSDEATESGRSL